MLYTMNSMNDQQVRDFFSAEEAAKLGGLTKTMVDYLCRTKLLVPTLVHKRRRGQQRRYSFGDVIVLRALARMLSAGVSVSRLKSGLAALRKFHPEITPESLPGTHLVGTDGHQLFFRHRNDAIEELTGGQYSFAFVLELVKVKEEVLEQLVVVKSADESTGKFAYRLRSA